MATVRIVHKREQSDYSEPSPKRKAELCEAIERNVAAGRLPHQDIEVRTRGELIWTQEQLPLNNTEPSPDRQEELRHAHAENVRNGRAPYEDVRVRTRGELDWIIRERGWQKGKPNLNGIYLEDMNLKGFDFAFASLERAHLYRTDLSDADLNGAKMFGADLAKANLCGAILGFTWMNEGTNLNAIVLDSKTRFVGARWNNVPLALVAWSQVPRLGDEREIEEARNREERIQACIDVALAYRTLAITLKSQGLIREASVYRLREQQLERQALRLAFKPAAWLFSWLLDMVAGYGERPIRALRTYVVVVLLFAAAYFGVTNFTWMHTHVPGLSWDEALVLSISAFHGRGFFQGSLALGDWVARLAAVEAVGGLFIELIFIATFSRRFLSD